MVTHSREDEHYFLNLRNKPKVYKGKHFDPFVDDIDEEMGEGDGLNERDQEASEGGNQEEGG